MVLGGFMDKPIDITGPDVYAGFTLVELLVTLTILLILLVVGVPSAQHLVDKSKLTATSNDLVSALQYARSTAIARGEATVACPSEDGKSCQDTTNWEVGWIVFVDRGSPGVRDTDDPILRVHGAAKRGVSIAGSKIVRYRATGAVDLRL